LRQLRNPEDINAVVEQRTHDFPRTETFKVKKKELKAVGVTEDTFDAENKDSF
jgi:hypothetical protein